MPPSFHEFYEHLPPEAQQKLVEADLIPLLKHASAKRARKVLKAAARLRKRHQGIAILDLKAKKADVDFLFDELAKDSKRSYVTESSYKPDILTEIISSLTDWFTDIWSVAFEHGVEYALAHECLLFVCTTLTRLSNVRSWSVLLLPHASASHFGSSCKCSLSNMYIPVTLKSKLGRTITTFHIDGAHNLDRVTQFIWRDMFLSMLAKGGQRERNIIPQMLAEIERVMDSKGLTQMLSGGGKCQSVILIP